MELMAYFVVDRRHISGHQGFNFVELHDFQAVGTRRDASTKQVLPIGVAATAVPLTHELLVGAASCSDTAPAPQQSREQ